MEEDLQVLEYLKLESFVLVTSGTWMTQHIILSSEGMASVCIFGIKSYLLKNNIQPRKFEALTGFIKRFMNWADIFRVPRPQVPVCDQQDPLNWNPGRLLPCW